MSDAEPDDALPAGEFSGWLASMVRTLDGAQGSDVPCGSCTACCRSAQFVHIEPDEHAALARIPSALLFPAPRLPAGHVLLGYDEQGRCPMLVEDRCSIYEDRPRTCRTYDCRVFAATDIEPDAAQPDIVERVRRWRFDHPTELDALEHRAVQAAARFVRERATELPGQARGGAVQQAVLAIRAHAAFLTAGDAGGPAAIIEPSVDAVAARLGDDRRR
jgi:uncharacterized protein